MLSLFRTLSLRYLWRHWLRAALVIASITLGVATWVTTEVLYTTVVRSLRQAASPLRGNAELYITNHATRFISASLGDRVARDVPAVERVEPILIDNVTVLDGRPQGSDALLLGLRIPEENDAHDPLDERQITTFDVDLAALKRGLAVEKGQEWLDRFGIRG